MEALFRRSAAVFLSALLLAAGGAAAQAPQAAGRFVAVTGEVAVVGADGVRRSAERGGDIREGDTIVTGADALAQARMSDGGLISVRAESEFKLEQFAYKGREDRNASFVVNIIKGGFRTITGLIAQVNRSGYRISTPAATIGVRGTHFEVVHVLPQVASQQVPAGTYNRVFEGITTVQNPAGALLQVVRDQTAFAALQGGTPTLVAPPALIFGRPTPVPRAAAPQGTDRAHKDAIKGESRAAKMDRAFKGQAPTRLGDRPVVREAAPTTPLESTTTLRSVPLTPIDTTTIQVAPTTTTLSPTTTTLSPTTTTISPTLSTTTTLSPTTTTTSTTTLTSPTLSTTTTLSPTTTTTTISPTTTTISPTLSTTTTISPTLSTTTTLSPTTTTTTTTSPTLTSPTLTSPTLITR
jgi:hypothetical protein